jgi:hypothetical protein
MSFHPEVLQVAQADVLRMLARPVTEAESEAAPYLVWEVEWQDVKSTIQRWIKEFSG